MQEQSSWLETILHEQNTDSLPGRYSEANSSFWTPCEGCKAECSWLKLSFVVAVLLRDVCKVPGDRVDPFAARTKASSP